MGWIGKYTCVDHKRNDDTKTEFKNTGQNFKISNGHKMLTESKEADMQNF
jgi:hypothetical protein